MRTIALSLLLFVAAQPTAPIVVVNKSDLGSAQKNRAAIEKGLLGGGVVTLPAGITHIDRSLLLGPEHSGGTLQGSGPLSVLKNSHGAGTGENMTVGIGGLGISYIQFATVQGGAYILDPTIPGTALPWDHPQAQTHLLKPGCVVYTFQFNSFVSNPNPPYKRRIVVSFDKPTRRLVLDAPADPSQTTLKWMAGFPIVDVAEGARTVTLLNPAHAVDYPAGRAVYVTSGPSVANEACGEHRTVLAAAGATVTLDRPVTRSHADATLALVSPVSNVTLSRFSIGVPLQPLAPPLFAKFAVGLKLDRVYSNEPNSAGLSIACCGPLTLTDCEVNNLVVNNISDTTIQGGLLSQLYGEESSTSTTVRNVIIRANSAQPNTGIVWHNGSDRLRLDRVRIEGFGLPHPSGGWTNAFNIQGRGLFMSDVTVSMTNNIMCGYVQGDGGTIWRLTSNTGPTVYSGRGWRIVDSSCPGWDVRAGTSGVATGTPNFPAVTEWTVRP